MNQTEAMEHSRTDAAKKRRPDLQRSYIIPVVSKTFIIMDLLKNSERPLRVDELTRITGIAKSTVYRILRTLSAYGYLPNGADGVYAFRRLPALHVKEANEPPRNALG
jgi:Fic family protein